MFKLKQSGCKEMFIGIESGSPRILKMIHKTSDVVLIKRTIDRVFQAGINVKGYFIFGFETERSDDMQMSFDLAKNLKEISLKSGVNFRTSVFQFRPYHGTELYYDMIRKGRIIDEVVSSDGLSINIGRRQFNFTSGNFSEVSDDDLQQFIIRTNGVNQ
ncbi:MAG: radical SAM protein [Minisyncoccia bacterium]